MKFKEKINVLYVTDSAGLAGSSRSLLDILSGLNREVVHPHVVLSKHGPMENKLKQLGVPFSIIPYTRNVMDKDSVLPPSIKFIINRVAIRRFKRLFVRKDIDVVHNNNIIVDSGMAAARDVGIPYVSYVRECVKEDHNLVFINEDEIRSFMNNAAMNLFISNFVAKKFEVWTGDAKKEIIYNAVSLSGQINYGRETFTTDVTKIVMLGCVVPCKRQLDAIKAVKKVKEEGYSVSLKIVGILKQNEYVTQCLSYLEQNSMEYVTLEPFTDDATAVYQQADIALMCSHAEGMGRVTVEGMMCGCLEIGANAGATPELIENGKNGLLYESGNSEDLASKVIWAIENKDKARGIAEFAQKEALAKYDKKAYARKITQIYQEIAKNRL